MTVVRRPLYHPNSQGPHHQTAGPGPPKKMDTLDCTKQKAKRIISRSRVPEDPFHAQNTLDWLLKLDPRADVALQLAAFAHDIERALKKRKVRRGDFADYDRYKAAHAEHGARILQKIMTACRVPSDLAADVSRLVRRHEHGGNPRSDLLKDADSLSFFEVNLPFYFERNGSEETIRRGVWGYRRLSPGARLFLGNLHYPNTELGRLLETIIQMGD